MHTQRLTTFAAAWQEATKRGQANTTQAKPLTAQPPISPLASSRPMSRCKICDVLVRSDRMDRHMTKVHSGRANIANQPQQAGKPKRPVSTQTSPQVRIYVEKPNIILRTLQASKVEGTTNCDNCGKLGTTGWRYIETNRGAVHLCSSCENAILARHVNSEDANLVRQLLEYLPPTKAWQKYRAGGQDRIALILQRYQARRKHLENIKPPNITWREAWKLAREHGDEYLIERKNKYESKLNLLWRKAESRCEFSHDSSDHYEDGGAIFNGGWP